MPTPWITRRFAFDLPVERIDTILSRLRGAVPRIESAVRELPTAALTRRDGERWSILEHIGHLADLEALHVQRLDEIAAGAPMLCSADLENTRTWEAQHNDRPRAEVLTGFATARAGLVERLAVLDAEGLARHARHPRLEQPMRALDVAAFAAEHDDHHIATLEALARTARPRSAR